MGEGVINLSNNCGQNCLVILFKGKVPKAKKLQKQNIKSFGVIVQTTYRLFQISHRTWDNVIEEESPCELPP